jgi:hypothetical protein
VIWFVYCIFLNQLIPRRSVLSIFHSLPFRLRLSHTFAFQPDAPSLFRAFSFVLCFLRVQKSTLPFELWWKANTKGFYHSLCSMLEKYHLVCCSSLSAVDQLFSISRWGSVVITFFCIVLLIIVIMKMKSCYLWWLVLFYRSLVW